jgi:hypothetical protein
VNTLKGLIETESSKTVLDLTAVSVADHDAAPFLASCELKGIESRISAHFFVMGLRKNRRVISGCFADDYAASGSGSHL